MASMSKVIRKLDAAIDTVKAVYQDERESGETVYVALSMEELQKTLTDIRNELKSRVMAEEMKEMRVNSEKMTKWVEYMQLAFRACLEDEESMARIHRMVMEDVVKEEGKSGMVYKGYRLIQEKDGVNVFSSISACVIYCCGTMEAAKKWVDAGIPEGEEESRG